MNIKDVHGKQIKSVYWPDGSNGAGACLNSSETILLEMSGTYHGDHDEFWIVESRKIGDDFKEVARHNPKFVEGWAWA